MGVGLYLKILTKDTKMKIKKLDELMAECDNKAYCCEIVYNQNMGLQIYIGTKYLKGGNPTGDIKILYRKDWCENSKKMVKDALKWLEKEDFRERE